MSEICRDTVLHAFASHIGEGKGISASQLVEEIAGIFVEDADPRRLRRVIEELRREGHPICGTPETGYYVAADDAELDRACGFLYERAMTSLSQVAAMKRVTLPDLRGQLNLPVQLATQEEGA